MRMVQVKDCYQEPSSGVYLCINCGVQYGELHLETCRAYTVRKNLFSPDGCVRGRELENPYKELERRKKAEAIALAIENAYSLMPKDIRQDYSLLDVVASMEDSDWVMAANAAGKNVPSEETKDAVYEILQLRWEHGLSN